MLPSSPYTPPAPRRRRDSGLSSIELLVAMIIGVVLAGIIGALVITSTRSSTVTEARHTIQNELNTASTQIVRDITDGSRIRKAEASALAVDVVRDGKCQTRDWKVDEDTLTVTTTFYDGTNCTGGSTERTQDMVTHLAEVDEVFAYFSTMSGENAISAPADPLQVGRVGWKLAATPDHPDSIAAGTVLRLESGAAFSPKGSSTDGTGAVQDAKAPVLRVATADAGVEGIDKPVLAWTDLTPELTSGWAVFRIANPDGTTDSDPARTTWAQLAFIPTATPAPGTMTYTDTSLPAGYTAQYVVRAVVPSGNGPESNQISTGLRPAAPTTISVDGESTKLNLTWPSAIGATGYDLYRSSGGAAESGPNTLTLYRTWSQISGQVGSSGTNLTWSESPGYGRSYNYTVVATNRWEHLATDPARKSQSREVASGTLENARVNGTAARHERLRPARDGDFTAAATPTFSLALASATSATDYGTTVTWTPATWTGGGPLVVDGKSRDIWWTAQREGATIWTKSTTSPRKDTGTRADITYGYRVQTCNDSGCSPLAAERSILQRPAVPAAPAAALSGLTTRQATITAATSPSATSWQVQKVTGPGSASMGGIKATNGSRQIVYAELGHNAAHTWQSRSTNVAPSGVAGGGTSAWGAAGGVTTAELRVWLSDGSSTTRSVSARLHNWGGNNANLTVEGFQTQPSNGGGQAHTFDPLTHNTVFTMTARLSDGYNSVAYQDNIRTQTLSTPTISDGWSNTRRIDLTLNAGNGTPQIEIAGEGNRTGNGRYSWDPLRHATTYQAYASNSDGYNSIVIGPVAVGTARLGVSTPSCNASRDGQYAPTTVRFTSSGSLNRSSVHAGSAGYYTALATNSNSDGYNYVSASNDCGISVEARPIVNGGASGTPSATCTQYIRAADGLFGGTGGGAPSGTSYGAKESEYGVYRSGAIATSNLSCTMIRVYALSYVEDGAYAGSWGVAVIWNQGGSGAS